METFDNSYITKYEQIAEANGVEIPDHFQDKIMQYLLDPNTLNKLEKVLLQIFTNCETEVLVEFVSAISEFISECIDDFGVTVDPEHNKRVTDAFMKPIYQLMIRFQKSRVG